MKYAVLLFLGAFLSLNSFAKTVNLVAVTCDGSSAGLPSPAVIRKVGYRLLEVNGQVYKNYSIAFVPTVQEGLIFGKLWVPGEDPHSPFTSTHTLRCQDPFPPISKEPPYYPDTYKK